MELENLTLEEFISLPGVADFIVPYDSTIRNYTQEHSYVRIGNVILGEFAIFYVEKDYIDQVIIDLELNNINLSPIILTLMGRADIEAAGILQTQQQPYLDLRGQGVLIGIVDTGVDYTKEAFIYEDGTSKIESIWDQTQLGNVPDGFFYGTEYTNEQINQAIASENPLDIVGQTDDVGHGTFLASVAASHTNDNYIGAAPDADLIVVKLRTARSYHRESFLIPPEQQEVYESTDMTLGIEYMLKKAQQLNKPLVICIGMGTNDAGHDGFNALEEYFSRISVVPGICVCAAAGNESQQKHHTQGKIINREELKEIQIQVPENAYSFPVSIWTGPSDRFSVSVLSPVGELVERVPPKAGIVIETRLSQSPSIVVVRYHFPMRVSGSQFTLVQIIDPIPGIWTIRLYGDDILEGTYHAWLPVTGNVSPGIEFIRPIPNTTITVPATGFGSITCGAYNIQNNILYDNSSWGPTRLPMMSPDIVAPGVNVTGIYPSGPGTMTGTSTSTALVTGACALMMQWGIVQGNDITLNTYRIRALLIRGTRRSSLLTYPNIQWGYGELDLFNAFYAIRTL